MVTYVHRSSNFIRLTIVLLQLLRFGLIPENAALSCVKRYRMEGEEGERRRELSVSSRLLALCFIRVEKGGTVQWPGAKATFLQSKQDCQAVFSCLVPFLSPSGSPRKMLAYSSMTLCSHLTNGLAGSSFMCWLCCCPGTAAMCCTGLVQQSLLPAKIPWMLLGYHCLQSACSFSMHAAAGSYGAETWKIASRDLALLFQTPISFTEIRCVLCVRKN